MVMGDFLKVFLFVSFCFNEGGFSLAVLKKEIKCKEPDLLQNGFREGTNFSHGAEIKYICKKGYIINGSPLRKCSQDGEWTGVQPFCNECAKVGTEVLVRKGIIFLQALILRKRSFVVSVMTNDPDSPEDDVNLAPGAQPYAMVDNKIPRRQKIANGTKIIALNPLKGTFMLATVTGINTLNESSTYRVFFADNTTAVVPLEQIRSLEQPIFCAVCDRPETPEHADREDNLREFISGMEVTYKCKENFKLIGTKDRKCLPDGQWSGLPPTCKAIACDQWEVTAPSNGQRIGAQFRIGGAVNFTCDDGYALDGKKSLQCMENGRWSSSAPKCTNMCVNRNFTCKEWEKCSFVAGVGPKCICRKNTECTAIYSPVCGTDANTYNNYCMMKATACRENKTIEQLNYTVCIPAGVCQIKPVSPCRASFSRFWYNPATKQCENIIAGGCHRSGWNGFYTKNDCESICLADICALRKDSGPCTSYRTRWAFDKNSGKCIKFKYGGCSGNENNFQSEDDCRRKCLKKAQCNKCSPRLLNKACKSNTFALVVKVQKTLAPDTKHRLLKYQVKIKKIFQDKTQTLSKGKIILNVQYTGPGHCACSKFFPQRTFLVVGGSPKTTTKRTGLTVERGSYVQRWNKKLEMQLKKLCKAGNTK